MASNQVGAAQAANRDVGNTTPCSRQDCSDTIHISVFFDGTGNHKDEDEAPRRWSNPARMWRAARMFSAQTPSSTYAIYVSGVGTPFNGQPLSVADAKDIKAEDGMTGGAAGSGGGRRLEFGQQQVNDALRLALLSNAKSLGGKVAKYAEAGKNQSFDEVKKALGKHRLVKQINVSIFGFSRGAALARAFCNQWLWQCSEDHGQLSYQGIPIRFAFLGLFDTVASFGLPATNAANWAVAGGFQGRDLVVDKRVERCVHFVAAHELRFAFPVDLIRRDGKTHGNWLEKVYPGVHSDVGGGYEPLVGADGKPQANRDNQGIDNNYARIPMRDMMAEAENVGVRLLGYADVKKVNFPIFQERFECRPETEKAYQNYRAACNPSGTVEQQVQKHMEQLYSAYGTLHRQGKKNLTQREHQAGQSWALGPADMATEIDNYHRALADIHRAAGIPVPAVSGYIAAKGIYAMWIQPAAWQMDAWKRTASGSAVDFIDQYVHDSKVGFLNNREPFSYFSKRGISESSHSVQGWFEENVAGPFGHAYEATADATKKAAHYAEKKGKEAYDATVDAAKKTERYVADKAEQAYDATVDAAKKTEQYVANKAEQAYDASVDAAKKTEQYMASKAEQAYDATADLARQTASKGQQVLEAAGSTVSTATKGAVDSVSGAWGYLFGH
jgi:hypothetical protein